MKRRGLSYLRWDLIPHFKGKQKKLAIQQQAEETDEVEDRGAEL